MPGIWIVLEQPVGSLLFEVPAVRDALDAIGAVCVTVNLGKWGSESQKPVWLWGTAPWLIVLSSLPGTHSDDSTWTTLATVDENGKVTGGKNVKASEEYPPDFCVSHLLFHRR